MTATIMTIDITSPASTYGIDDVVTFDVTLDSAVDINTFTGETITIALNNGAFATYTGGNILNATVLTFEYIVASGDDVSDIEIPAGSFILSGPSTTVLDAGTSTDANVSTTGIDPAGTFSVDTTAPMLTLEPIDPFVNSIPTIEGTTDDASSDVMVTVTVDGVSYSGLATITAGSPNTWEIAPNALLNGTDVIPDINGQAYNVVVTSMDAAGNSAVPVQDNFTFDGIAPVVPTVEPLTANVALPTLTGTAESDNDGDASTSSATTIVTVGGASYVVDVINGEWSLDLSTATSVSGVFTGLNDVMGNGSNPQMGTNEVEVTTIDLAGNITSDTTTLELLIDTETPLVTSAALAETLTEDDDLPDYAASGDITFNDAPVVMDEPSLTVDIPPNSFVGLFSATLPNLDANGNGTITWEFDVSGVNAAADLATIQSLGLGESLVQTYTITLTDEDGNFFTENVAITIEGTNDTPVISGGPVTIELEEADVGLTADGTFVIADIDDLNTADILSVNAGTAADLVVVGNQGTLTDADLFAMFSVNLDSQSQVSWDFDSVNEAFNFLSSTETLTLTFNVNVVDDSGDMQSDTATETVTIVIEGTNDAAVITGDVNNSNDVVIEAGSDALGVPTADNLVVTGDLDHTDVDNTDGVFQATTAPIDGDNGYGSLTIDANGTWTYTLGTGSDAAATTAAAAAVDALDAGEPVTDTVTVFAEDGTAQLITITINGANDAAVITGVVTGSVNEGGVLYGTDVNGDQTITTVAETGASGQLFHTDVDGDDVDNVFVEIPATAPQVGTYGSLTLTDAGLWTYTLGTDTTTAAAVNALDEGDMPTETFTVTTGDGTEQVITVTVNGSNDAAVIGGVTSGAVVEAGVDSNGGTVGLNTISGTLTSMDVDADDAASATDFIPITTASVGTYGSLTITDAGVWTYTLGTDAATAAAVDALDENDSETETFTVETVDGTQQVITVTVQGSNDAPVLNAATATVADTSVFDEIDISGNLGGTDVDDADASLIHSIVGGTAVAADPVAGTLEGTSTALVQGGVTYGTLTVFEDGSYNIDLDDAAVNNLDEAVTDNFDVVVNIQVDDGSAMPTMNTFTVSFDGDNDVPVLTDSAGVALGSSEITGDVVEDMNVDVAGNLTTTSNFFYTDAELNDTHSVTVQNTGTQTANGSSTGIPNLGTLTSQAINGAENGQTGNIQWTYTIDNALIQDLEEGQQVTETFDVLIDDGTNSIMTTIDVTVTGVNDVPTFSIGGTDSASGSATEAGVNLMANGTITINDVDLADTAAVSLDAANPLSIDGTNANMSIDTAALETALENALTFTGGIDGSSTSANVAWTFNSGAVDFDDLGDGESLELTYTILATDDEGATNAAPQTIEITINGTNDAPTLTVDNATASVDEGATLVLTTAMLAATDVDASDGAAELTYTVVTTVANGQLFIDTDGSGVLDNGETALAANDTFTQADIDAGLVTYTHDGTQDLSDALDVTVSDDGTGLDDSADTVAQTLNIAVNNVNDDAAGQPVIVGTIREDQNLTVDLSGITDEDGIDGTTVFEYQWLRDGVAITDATLDNYTLGDDDVGGLISVQVSFTDLLGGEEVVTSASSAPVVNVNDAPVGADGEIDINEDEPHTFTEADFGFADNIDDPANLLSAVIITSLPGNGMLTLDGNAVNMGDSVSAADIVAGDLVFTPTLNENGDAYTSLDFQVVDNGGTANGGVNTSTANTLTFNVAAVNDAPTVTAPSLTISEGETVTITNAILGIADVDDADADVSISVGTPTGGEFQIGGSEVTSFTLAQVNAGDVSFVHDGDEDAPAFNVTASNADGMTSGPVPASITFTNVNDAPDGMDATITIAEDVAHVFDAGDFGFTDVDTATGPDSLSAVIITELPSPGTLTLNGVEVMMGDSVSVTDIDNDLLVFTPDLNENGAGYTNFTFQVVDDGGAGGTDLTPNTLTFDVTPVNDLPDIDGNSDTNVSGDEDVAITGTIIASDVEDGTDLDYTIENGDGPANGTVSIDLDSGVYEYTGNQDYNGADSFTVTVTDSEGGVSTDVVNVTVDAVNDAPVLTVPAAQIVAEGDNAQVTLIGISVADVDSGAGTITVTLEVPAGEGSLTVGAVSGAASVTDNGTGSVTLTGTLADVNATLAADVTYEVPNGDFNTVLSGEDVEVTITVDDGGNSGSGVNLTDSNTIAISITPTDDDVVVDVSGVSGDAHEEAIDDAALVPTFFADGTTVTDVDVEDFDGGVLSVAVTSGNATDLLNLTDTADVSIVGTDVTVDGDVVGTLANVNSYSLTVTFNDDADAEDVEAVIAALNYATTSDVPDASRDITIDLSNGDTPGTALQEIITVAINANNDSPIATDDGNADPDAAGGIRVTENSTSTFNVLFGGAAGVTEDSDPDHDVTELAVTFADGNTVTSAVPAIITTDMDALVTVRSNGLIDYNISSNDATLAFQALREGETATDSFTYTIEDPDGASSTATVYVTIVGANDAVDAQDDTIAVTENGPALTLMGNITANDEDVDIGDEFEVVNVQDGTNTTAVSTANGFEVTLTGGEDDIIVQVNSDGSYTVAIPESLNALETITGSFNYTVEDTGGAQSFATVTLEITGENDAPEVSGDVVLAASDEDTVRQITAAELLANSDDVDSDAELSVLNLVVSSGNGTLVSTGNGTWDFTPAANDATSVTFDFQVTDGIAPPVDASATLDLIPVNDAPVIDATASDDMVSVDEDNAVTGTVVASDVDDATLTYSAVDGANGTVTIESDGEYTYTPAPDYNGTDSFVVTVTDAAGLTDEITVNVTIDAVNDAPVIDAATSDDMVSVDEDNAVTGTVVASDVDDATLIYSAVDGANGTVTIESDGEYTYTPAPDFNGTDSFVVTVTDAAGLTDEITVNVTIDAVNDAPVIDAAASDVTGTADEDNAVTGTVVASDVDDATLIYSAVDGANGTVTIESDGEYTYTPAPDFNGTDSFVVTVTDAAGLTDEITVNVTIDAVNDAPVIDAATSDDMVSVDEDNAVTGTVVASDVDDATLIYSAVDGANGTVTIESDGEYTYTPAPDFNGTDSFVVTVTDAAGLTDEITVNVTIDAVNDAPVIDAAASDVTGTADEDNAVTGTVVASDVDDATLIYSAVDGANGTVTIESDGEYTYTPAPDFNGTDSFVVTVTDAAGLTDEITVNVTIDAVNDAPVIDAATSDDMVSVDEDNAVTGTVVASDVDDATLIYSAVDGANGTVTIESDGEYTYTPAPDFNGTDSFVVTVTDAAGLTDEITVNVTIDAVNDAPVIDAAASDVTGTADEDNAVTGTVVASDVDDATLIYSAVDGANGTVTIESDGEYTYTPAPDFNGTDSFVVTVTDAAGLTDEITVNVTIDAVNDAPVIDVLASGDTISGDEDIAITGTVVSSDVDTAGITYSVGDGDNGTVTIDALTGEYTYTPAPDFNGTDSFVVTVFDGELSDTITINVTIDPVDDAAVVSGDFSGEVTEGDVGDAPVIAQGVIEIMDVDDMPTFPDVASTAGDNGLGLFELTNGEWTFTLDQLAVQNLQEGEMTSDTITFIADDGTAQEITVVITGTDDNSVVTGTTTATVLEGELDDGDITASGELTITSSGGGSPTFLDAGPAAGSNGFGVFSITNGVWNYVATQVAVNDLDDGDTVIDSFTFTANDGTEQLVAVTISGANNTLIGTPNADILAGSDGIDTIIGMAGDDFVTAGDGNDVIDGEAGDDIIDGGEGIDVALYGGSTNGFSVTGTDGVFTVDDTFTSAGSDEGTDTLTNVEFINFTTSGIFAIDSFLANNEINGTADDDVNIFGTVGADIINGLDGNDIINASNGNDSVFGGSGDDTLIGGSGGDSVDGGDGTDQARYANSNDAVTVNLATGEASGGHAEGDLLSSIEDLFGSAFGDTLTGDAGDNVLSGFNGDDTLAGAEGVNTLIGGSGDDTFIGGNGDDFFIGGGGFADTIDYSGSDASVEARLGGSQAFDGGFATGDSFQSIEDIIGSDFGDILVGNVRANELTGGAGNDFLNGDSGTDTLLGGAGNDTLVGGFGQDTLDGGDGIDTVRYANANSRAVVDLSTGTGTAGHSFGDTLINIENLFGSQFNDVFIGDAGDNVLNGSGGVDRLTGSEGNDTLIGGEGNDRFIFTDNWDNDTITDFEDGGDLLDFRTVTGVDAFSDLMVANNANGDAVVSFGDDSVTLTGIDAADIDDGDFLI